jgi:hypothetical protein
MTQPYERLIYARALVNCYHGQRARFNLWTCTYVRSELLFGFIPLPPPHATTPHVAGRLIHRTALNFFLLIPYPAEERPPILSDRPLNPDL